MQAIRFHCGLKQLLVKERAIESSDYHDEQTARRHLISTAFHRMARVLASTFDHLYVTFSSLGNERHDQTI
jgi:hypothetical protein